MSSSKEGAKREAVRRGLVRRMRRKIRRANLASDSRALQVVTDRLWPIVTK